MTLKKNAKLKCYVKLISLFFYFTFLNKKQNITKTLQKNQETVIIILETIEGEVGGGRRKGRRRRRRRGGGGGGGGNTVYR